MPDSTPSAPAPNSPPSPALEQFIQSLPSFAHEHKRLEGDDAINLWWLGWDYWNKFFESRMDWSVSFGEVNFSSPFDNKELVDFSHFIFPNGGVNFSCINFDGKLVSFHSADFGTANVQFSDITFGEARVDFNSTNFGTGGLHFLRINFGTGEVTFAGANFSNRYILFEEISFGQGGGSFQGAQFDCGGVLFNEIEFGDGDVLFNYAKFKGDISFFNATFNGGRLDFSKAEVGGAAYFTDMKNTESLEAVSFQYARFERLLALGGTFNCVPDLRSTKLDHHLDIHDLKVETKSLTKGNLIKKFKDPKDSARLQRLKELAEANKDHEAAQEFYAQEMRAARWHLQNPAVSLLHIFYDLISNYGRSIWRPFAGLFIVGLLSALVYMPHSQALVENPQYKQIVIAFKEAEPFQFPTIHKSDWEEFQQAALISATNILPFISSARESRNRALERLYKGKENTPLSVDVMMFLQGIFSFLFLFLIGLALRNRFRL